MLTLAYMNRDALEETIESGEAVLSAAARWRKGETSGNRLRIISLTADCDGDAIRCFGRTRRAGLSSRDHKLLWRS